MKLLTTLPLLSIILSCNSNQNENYHVLTDINVSESDVLEEASQNEDELKIGERIDGPANIRDKPNGDVLFELYDNVLVDVSSKSNNGWHELVVYFDLNEDEYDLDSLTTNRPILSSNDTIGKILKDHYVSTGRGKEDVYAMLYGYTYESNIKPESVIETVLTEYLDSKSRNYNDWKPFIHTFQLMDDAVDFKGLNTYYNYENVVDDPSPGFRIVLLFKEKILVGILHSRKLLVENMQTHKLNWNYYTSFFNDYPEDDQKKFIEYMNEWLEGVD